MARSNRDIGVGWGEVVGTYGVEPAEGVQRLGVEVAERRLEDLRSGRVARFKSCLNLVARRLAQAERLAENRFRREPVGGNEDGHDAAGRATLGRRVMRNAPEGGGRQVDKPTLSVG
jgi:hypothetical protein